jgi:phage baseplate assembly protein gpV
MSHRWGTDIRRGIDAKALSEALARPGTDLRYWVSHGTVGTQDDAGNLDATNPNSIWIGPEGVECDVRLEPLMIHVCCRFAGISGGDVTAYPPIHPGDQVLVTLPEGFAHLPVIVAVLNSRACKQPLDENQVPIFDNKRLLVYAKTAAIDVRNAGGVQVLIGQDGSVEIHNSQGATHKLNADGSIDIKTGPASVSLSADGAINIQTGGSSVDLTAVSTTIDGVITQLGGDAAVNPLLLSVPFAANCWAQLISALMTYTTAIQPTVDPMETSTPPFQNAITATIAALAASLSAKVVTA